MRIPAAQQDRSRTPRRPHHDWHQPVPTFRGPMHYAMTTPRPSWPPTGLPAPPPLISTFPSRPTWTPTPPTPLFPPTPPGFSQGLHDHTTFTPQRNNNITPRSPMFVSSPLGTSPIQHGYTCRPIDIPPVDHWKPDVDFHDSNKVNGLDFPSKIRQSRFSSYKDIEGIWILYKSHYGSSCTKGFTILGFVESPMEERPTSSPLTTSALLYSSQNWCLNSELRYVDNRLCLADPSWDYEISFTNFLNPEFYGNPIILETEPDQEFLGFCIGFEPFALCYSPPRDFNQVMAPFSASPLAVQLSGFVSRLFLVAKCAHPASERTRGFAALHR